MFQNITVDKLSNISGKERFAADIHTFELVVESFGLGVGWGSNRPSSFFAYLISNTGLVGLGLFIWFVWHLKGIILFLIRNKHNAPIVYGLIMSLGWMLTAAIVAVPDIIFLYEWILLGLLFAAFHGVGCEPNNILSEDKRAKRRLLLKAM